MIHSYFNRYPKLKSAPEDGIVRDAIDQSSFKNCIKDFNQGMIDSGMIKTTALGQLDLNNIPDANYWNSTANLVNTLSYTYAPLIYTFSDDLNSIHPLYIKVNFQLKSITARTSLATNNAINNLVLTTNIEFSKNINFTNSISKPALFLYNTTAMSSLTSYVLSTQTQQMNSEIIIGDVSLFNICPFTTYSFSHSSYYAPTSLLSFMVNRKKNGDVIIIMSSGDTSTTSTTSTLSINYNTTSVSYIYANNSTANDVTTNNIFESITQSQVLNNQQEMFLSASQYTNPDNNLVNYDILNGNLNFFPPTANNFIIKIKLPDGIFYRYKLIRHPMYTYSFYNSDRTSTRCIFIKMKDEEANE